MKKISVVFDFSGTLAYESVDFTPVLFPGILSLLEKSKAAGLELYLWTALGRTSTQQALAKLGISHFFTDIRTPSDCRGKPHPEGLTQMLSDKDPLRVIVIGDSPGDMNGAKSFGAYAIGALWNDNRKEEILLSAGADVTTDKPEECFQLITDYQKSFA